MALAVGMAEGMGMGDNTKASIITRGLAEMARLGVRLGADPGTFLGLAGCLLYTSDAADERSSVDLGGRRILKKKNTCTSPHCSTE